MSRFIHTIYSDGAAISDTTPAMTGERRLTGLLVHLSSAAATSENLTLTLDSVDGAAHDVVLYKINLGASSLSDVVYTDFNMPLQPGDALRTTYTNTDARKIGIRLILE